MDGAEARGLCVASGVDEMLLSRKAWRQWRAISQGDEARRASGRGAASSADFGGSSK